MKLTTEANNGSEVIMEITGTKRDVADKHDLIVDLYLEGCDQDWDSFGVDTLTKETTIHLRKGTAHILNVSNTYEDYMRLLEELELERPKQQSMEYWKPKINEGYSYFDSCGGIGGDFIEKGGYCQLDKKRIENYNAFPSKELAQKAVNLSKLGRLILLWQYSNDCIFYPDWLNDIQHKYYIIYDNRDKNVCYEYSLRQKSNNIHFETSEQVEAFIKVYDKEIKKIMGVE